MIESDEKIAAVSHFYAKVKGKKKDAYSNVQKKRWKRFSKVKNGFKEMPRLRGVCAKLTLQKKAASSLLRTIPQFTDFLYVWKGPI